VFIPAPAKTPTAPGKLAGSWPASSKASQAHSRNRRVHHLGLARAVAEERGVELVGPLHHAAGAHVTGIGEHGLRGAGRPQLLVAEEGNRLDTAHEVPPEGLDAPRTGEAAGHTNDCDRSCLLPRGLAPRLGPRQPRLRRGCFAAAEEGGQRRHGGIAEQVEQSDFAAKRLAQPDVHLGRQQRVTAEIEEVVVRAHAVEPEHLAPEGRDGALQVVVGIDPGRRRAGLAGGLGRGQGLAVHLAAGVERQGVEHHEGRRQHVVRQALPQVPAQLAGRRRLAGRHHVGHEPRLPRLLPGRDHGLGNGRVPQQGGLDLPQLDAETPHLDLVVDPPQELQPARRPPAHQVSRAIEACARLLAPGVGHEPLRRQLRPPQVAERGRRRR
jgi:hypothetical protein